MTTSSLRKPLGSNSPIGDICSDLYAERVMIPRISLLSILTGLSVLTLLFIRYRRRRTRQLAKFVPKGVVLTSFDNDDHTSKKRSFMCFLATAVAWLTIFLLYFNSSTSMTTTSMSATQTRPRIVFSFTTTSRRINGLKATLDALIHQEGDGFDLVYVIIPRIYRDKIVDIPLWLLNDKSTLHRMEFYGITFAIGTSPYHTKLRLIVLDTDFGPASKVLGTLLIEQDPDTLIVYGDDDRVYPLQLCERALHYTRKYPNDAIAVLGGWISVEDRLYCGRSLEVGVNSVSFVGGAGGVAVKRKFFGMREATMSAFQVANLSKACYLGDDFYLSHLLSNNGVRRRLVSDSCWNIQSLQQTFSHGGLSYTPSEHPGGANVEHYQQCIRELGNDQDLSRDGEFGSIIMFFFSRTWGMLREKCDPDLVCNQRDKTEPTSTSMISRFLAFVLAGVTVIICIVQDTAAMNGELRIYKEPEFKRLRRIIGVSVENLCYDMPCADLRDVMSSARWTELPAMGSIFADEHVKIAFYAGSNCTGKLVLLNTDAGKVRNFADYGMDNAITSFAVLKTLTAMQHVSSNIFQW
ncbi:unnamed protein product [Peronospora belbahrii]|uniref:Glycosyltransferase 2-like domain-containing protein n=1 Tax=Peronospora belbahrii TaxID=622444 RepID=A0AAU9LF03_9STRA|nr:unnamed protein product [Peronospora belbahrii]